MKFVNSVQSNRILDVQVMLRHIHVGVANQTLDRGQINSQGLHLRNISVTAAVRGQYSYTFNRRNFFFEFFCGSKKDYKACLPANVQCNRFPA